MLPTLYAAVKFRPNCESPVFQPQKKKWENTIESLNKMFHPYLASRFILLDSDTEGVLFVQEAARFLHLLQQVDLEMNPLRFHFALGVGNISGGLKGNPAKRKGPAFTATNRALKTLSSTGDGDVCVRLPSPFLTRIINSLFAVESDLRNDWSAAHRETIKLARQGMTQIEMAEMLGITQAAVSQRLKHARWDRYQQICVTLWELLTHVRWRTLLPWDLQQTLRKPK